MTTYDYGGWVILEKSGGNIFKILCEKQPELSIDDPSVVHLDFPNDTHESWTLDTRKRTVTIKNIWFESTANKDSFLAFLEDAQSGTLYLYIQISSTPTYKKFDGTNDKMPVKWSKPRGIKKLFGGDTGIWVIKQITFKQGGDLTTV